MGDLQVSQWRRYGHDRLYVNLPEGRSVAWFDRRTGELRVLDEGYRDGVLEVLRPHLLPGTTARSGTDRPDPASSGATPGAPVPVPAPVGAPPVAGPGRPPPGAGARGPGADLAANRPGEALRRKLDELLPGPFDRVLAALLGKRSSAYSWRRGLAGERRVGADLEGFAAAGWRVLHSVPLAGDVDIDHLLIGPAGVFTVNTKFHRGARIWVGDEAVKIGRDSYPYVRRSRAEARRAGEILTRACGFAVEARPVLAFVGADRLTVVPSLRDVHVLLRRELPRLTRLPSVWRPETVEAVHACARNPWTWPGG